MASKINWKERARVFISQQTRQTTPSRALRFVYEKVDGAEFLISLVQQAMNSAYNEGVRAGSRAANKQKEKEKDES